MQTLQNVLESPSMYHVSIQGKNIYAERLVPMPTPVARHITSTFPTTSVVTGGTKGLGLEYVQQVNVHEAIRNGITSHLRLKRQHTSASWDMQCNRNNGNNLMQDMEAQVTSYGVILSRQGFVPKRGLEYFARHGTCCYVVKCDVACSVYTNGVIEWVHEHLPKIGKVVHAAGLLGYGNIQDMTTSDFWLLALPKVSMPHPIRQNCMT